MSSLNSDKLQKLYIAFFGRPCDPAGMNYWLSKLENNVNLVDVAKAFSLQDEYKMSLTSSNSIEFQINQIHFNLFARKADFDSLNNWSLMYNKGELKLYELVSILTIDQSNLGNKIDNISLNDVEVLEKKVEAAELFTEQISKDICWINSYQPESIDPWILGKALQVGINYLNKVDSNYHVDKYYVRQVLQKMSFEKINTSTKPIIKIIVESIPVEYLGIGPKKIRYNMLKIAAANTKTLGSVHKIYKAWTPKFAAQVGDLPLHAGAQKFYKEVGAIN